MTLRLSTGLRNAALAHGSVKDILSNGCLYIYSGSQPASADAAPTGTLLCTITSGSSALTNEVLSSGTITLTSGSAGSINTLTVNSVSIIDAAVPYNSSLTQTAADLASAINTSLSSPEYTATSSGAVVTITAKRGTGTTPNTYVIAATTTTLTTSVTAFTGGVASANGLRWGYSSGGVLVKHPTQIWSGVASASGTAGWFRMVGSVADPGTLDSTESTFRMDGAISTSGAQLNMSSTSITSGATQTISSFPITLPTS